MSSLIALATKLIREHEGNRLFVYDDATGLPIVPGSTVIGYPTIGRGRNLATRGIAPKEADFLELSDIANAEEYARAYVGEAVWAELNDPRRAALLDMAHQLGPGGLGKFRRLREAIACGNWPGAKAELLNSLYAKQAPGRAARIAEMLLTGKAPA